MYVHLGNFIIPTDELIFFRDPTAIWQSDGHIQTEGRCGSFPWVQKKWCCSTTGSEITKESQN